VNEARALPAVQGAVRRARTFEDELLGEDPLVASGLPPDAAAWLALRRVRPALTEPSHRGEIGPVPAREYRVSTIDKYVQCPFKYFAAYVLQLGEEADEESGLSPRERGTLIHRLFERFYREWDAAGRGAITPMTLDDAVNAFDALAREELAPLSESDRVLEATRLSGSAVARGFAERVFQIECDAGSPVARRLLETSLNGTFTFPAGIGRTRDVAVRAKSDRIDVLDDGTLRVIDYKLSRPPREKGAVQLPVYGFCAKALLETADQAPHPVREAYYVSFGDDWDTVTPLTKQPGAETQIKVETGVQAFVAHVDAIERGEFPPRPDKANLCGWCAYALVCRKETVTPDSTPEDEGDGDAAEPV
jgi:RecB family exonuclease